MGTSSSPPPTSPACRASYPGGPQGVFLKRVSGDPERPARLREGAVYPAVGGAVRPAPRRGPRPAAPERAALRRSRSGWVRRAAAAGRVRASAAAGASPCSPAAVVPVYLLWPTPEIFNLALATAGLVAWRRERPTSRRCCSGLAAYSKPHEPGARAPARSWSRSSARRAGWREAAARGGAAWGRGGRGGGRGLRPRLAGHRRAELPGRRAQDLLRPLPLRPRRDLRLRRRLDDDRPRGPAGGRSRRGQAVRARGAGAGGGGAAAVVPAEPRLLLGRPLRRVRFPTSPASRRRVSSSCSSARASGTGGSPSSPSPSRGWATSSLIPDNWYGGGGTIGNRYFLNLVPLGLLLLPRGRGGWRPRPRPWRARCSSRRSSRRPSTTRSGRASTRRARAFRAAARRDHHARRPLGLHGRLAQAPALQRARRRRGAPTGRGPRSYFLWFPDDGTFGQETSFDGGGLLAARGGSAQRSCCRPSRPPRACVSRNRRPRGRHRDRAHGTRAPARRPSAAQDPGDRLRRAARAALGYYGTSLYPLRLGSRFGKATDGDTRRLGSFVVIDLTSPTGL